ncbi:Maf family protein [Bacillus horti]|nr:Maf family protein [Bacillus horti]
MKQARPIILASSSPRRKELLAGLGLSFSIQPSHIIEEVDMSCPPEEIVQLLAQQKAEAVAKEVQDGVVLGADTIVVIDGKVLGKPQTKEMAFDMLKQLQNHVHEVYSGVALFDVETKERYIGFQQTTVKMKALQDEEIQQYIMTGEPMDKAGSYAIQGIGATFVEEIRGDYFTVVGLPLLMTANFLKKAGIDILQQGNKAK